MLSLWRCQLTCCALIFAATIPSRAFPRIPEASVLHLPASRLLPARAQSLHLQVGFEEGFPHFDVAHAQGILRGVELRLHGLFHNAKVSGLGDTYRYNFSELEAGLRLGAAGPARSPMTLVPAAGYSRTRAEHRYSDGRESTATSRQVWGELLGGYSPAGSLGFSVAGRGLRNLDADTDTAAVILALSAPLNAELTLLGDLGFLIENPNGWRRPWGAGARVPLGRSSLVVYASNTHGTTVPAALAGTDVTFLNFRLVLGI